MIYNFQLQNRFHKLGVCLSHSMREILLQLIGGNFLEGSILSLRAGKTLRGTGDNWDL